MSDSLEQKFDYCATVLSTGLLHSQIKTHHFLANSVDVRHSLFCAVVAWLPLLWVAAWSPLGSAASEFPAAHSAGVGWGVSLA